MKVECKLKLDFNTAIKPKKAHKSDAGYDLFMPYGELDATGSKTIKKDYVSLFHPLTIDTGVHIVIPEGYVGMIKSKSGLNVNCGINGEGVVDAGYTGSIKVKLYSHSLKRHYFKTGDKLIQICIMPVADAELVETYTLEETERGSNGFGSTGR